MIDFELEFRAWDINQEKMMYVWDHVIRAVDNWAILQSFDSEYIMQYSGFKDKEWRKIFDWDILRDQHYWFTKWWSPKKNGSTYYTVKRSEEWYLMAYGSSGNRRSIASLTHYISVAGNIYETPELVPTRREDMPPMKLDDDKRDLKVVIVK